MQQYSVGMLTEFQEGAAKIIEVDGKSIGIYRIGDTLHALRNLCPHQGAPLCRGMITPLVVGSEPKHFAYEREGGDRSMSVASMGV